MRRLFLVFFLLSTLFAQEWENGPIFQLENAPPPFYPFSVSGEYLSVRKTKFKKDDPNDRKLRYGQWTAAFAYTFPFSEICGVIFGAGWVGTEVKMDDNPHFNETIFDYVNFSLGGFTNAFTDWRWTMSLSLFIDKEVFSLIDYALYQGVLWGKYSLNKTVEINVGFITEVGLKKDKIWPILGFAYIPCNAKWRLYVIYPVHMALEYDLTPQLTAAAALRFLRNRHRVENDEPDPQSIFEYHTWGGEFDLIYTPYKWVIVKGFLGSTLDGDLEIADRNGRHSTHYKFKHSLYSGINLILSF